MRFKNTFNTAKYVPFTAVEWRQVQTVFRSNSVSDLQKACDILSMWKCRMGNSTPIFIDISKLILNSLINDKSQTDLFNSWDADNNRLIYASVIIRFVNYVNEICQPDGTKILSIASAVSSVGIPAWIVQVRHEATHCQMPPINLMREAISFCRDWLWRHQWSQKFNEAIKELPKELYEVERNKRQAFIYHRIQESFELYHIWRKKNMNVRDISLEQRNTFPFKQMITNLTNHTEEFIQTFAQNCLPKQLKKVTRTKLLKMSTVSKFEQAYYFPVMQILNDKNVLSSLLLEITRNIADSSQNEEIRLKLSGWANNLLSAFFQIGSPRFATISDQTWKLILKHIVLSPQYFNDDQIEKILVYMKNKIPERSYNRLICLLKIGNKLFNNTVSMDVDNCDLSMYSVMTVSELQTQINNDKTFIKDSLTEEDWSYANMDDLGPLGLTSQQTAETLCLELMEDGSIPCLNEKAIITC